MTLDWIRKFENKKIVLLGFGVEGKSTYAFLLKHVRRCQVQIMDQNSDYVKTYVEEQHLHAQVYDKESYLKFDEDVDYVFKSPGIPLKQIEGYVDTELITSQTNEFIAAYKEKVIGITGTKGKSTTCSFLCELLRNLGAQVELVGNIGKPAFDYVGQSDVEYYVYELSSHQLETANVSPHISVLLNLFEEHLDHYHSYDHYAKAKLNIASEQISEDLFICGQLEKSLLDVTQDYLGKKAGILLEGMNEGVNVHEKAVIIRQGDQKLSFPLNFKRLLLGDHNLVNMSVAIYITLYLGYRDLDTFNHSIESFSGLPHRLAFVEKVKGVSYYNDSISTIPLATIAAINAISNVGTVIIGGMDRGIHYDELIQFFNENLELRIVLLPESGHKLYSEIKNNKRAYKVETMEEAVDLASSITSNGQACLLSPAAASYGFFKNFEDRGNQFETLVHKIK